MITCVLFDFDGTVFDTVEGITKSVQYAAGKLGLHPELESLRCFAGPPLADMFMEHFGLDRETALRAVADFRERYRPVGIYECRVFPGIRELLRDLRAAGYTLGIATSKPQPMAEMLLEREGMTALFDTIAGSREDLLNDTKADVLRRAMSTLHVKPEETVLVGDTKYDVIGARKCHVPCIGAGWGYAAPGELEEAGAAVIAANFLELKKLLLAERTGD